MCYRNCWGEKISIMFSSNDGTYRKRCWDIGNDVLDLLFPHCDCPPSTASSFIFPSQAKVESHTHLPYRAQ
jgi:hypothetical protein